jgi:hypothetical protein
MVTLDEAVSLKQLRLGFTRLKTNAMRHRRADMIVLGTHCGRIILGTNLDRQPQSFT